MQRRQQLLMAYEGFLVLLALVVAVLLVWDLSYDVPPGQQRWFTIIDRFVIIVYALDYTIRLVRTRNKRRFFLYHLPELIAVIPFDRAFRLARLLRIQRLLPLVRAYRLLMFSRRAWAGFLDLVTTNNFHHIVVFTVFLVLMASIGILHFESGVVSFGEAVWGSIVTLSTVGYGDIAPRTIEGRIIAVGLMIVGIGLLATLAGTSATFFLRRTLGEEFTRPEQRSARETLARAIRGKLERVHELELDDVNELVELAHSLRRLVKSRDANETENDRGQL
jgi:voltage-gated potassium channel